VALSAETGQGCERLMPAVFKMHRDWSTKVKTRDLNDWLALAVQRHPPPAVDGKRVRPKYMAQTKARPPTFVLFASRAAHLPDSYRRYLINSLRESFDLPGVPMRVTVKSGSNPYADAVDPSDGRARPMTKKFRGAKPEPKRPAAKPAAKKKAEGAADGPKVRTPGLERTVAGAKSAIRPRGAPTWRSGPKSGGPKGPKKGPKKG
jgi:GTP-binding protein